ncbi:hypothetical protein [Streptomyces turgidiscabies]|uniref:hypothetical protein n=1 Tax=Streptomyces turgidiscabies TaxID=85558 RepID=UPI0038F80FE0
MPQFSTSLSIEGPTRAVYQVTVNDRSPDGGTNIELMVGGFQNALDHTASDAAVQAFAAAYADAAGYTVVSVARLAVAETVL